MLDVRQHPHVALAVDVDAERVLGLARSREEVAALDDRRRLELEPVEGAARELDDVRPREEMARVEPSGDRHLLEEHVLVVPGAKLVDRAAEPAGELTVHLRLPRGERRSRERIALPERGEQPILAHLHRLDREREPVAIPQPTGRLVPEPGELADVVGHSGADRLRRLPGLAPLRDVVALAENPADRVVVQLGAAHDSAMAREAGLDRRLERHDPVPERLGHLVRDEGVVQHVELPAGEALCAVGTGGRDRAVQLAVGQGVRQGELGFHALPFVLVCRSGVRIPPGARGGEVEGPDRLLGPCEQRLWVAHGAAGYLRSPAWERTRTGRPPPGRARSRSGS